MERSETKLLNLHELLFLLYCGPISYWFFVVIPIDLIVNGRISELLIIILMLIPILVSFCIYLIKLSYFSIKLEKLLFYLMIINSFLLLLLGFYYNSSIVLVMVLYTVILSINAFSSPYLFAKILNLTTNKNKIKTNVMIFLIWIGIGIFYLGLFITFGAKVSLIISAGTLILGLFLQYFFQIKPKKFTQIQLLPFEYKFMANVNVAGITLVLILFWSLIIIIVKEFKASLFLAQYNLSFGRFQIIWIFLVINSIIGLIFYFLNKRLNLRFLFYVDYLIISLSVIIVLFWKNFIPIAFILVSSIGIVTFAFSLPDLIDVNKAVIGPSFMAFFFLLLSFTPIVHIIIYLMNTSLTDAFASYLLITLVVTMALISGIKFLPVPVNKEYLIISHKDGIPIFSAGNASKDEKIISGLLTGILTILQSSSPDKIKTIDHGDKKIIVSVGNRIFGVVVCDRKSKRVGLKLNEIVDLFEAGFDHILNLNSFNVQLFRKLPPLLAKKIDIFLKE